MDYLPPRSVQGTKKLMEGHRKGRTRPSNLREQMDPETMAMYPTPSASCQDGCSSTTRDSEAKNSSGWSVTRVGTGTKFGAKLNDVVNKLFTTPRQTNDCKDAAYQPTSEESQRSNRTITNRKHDQGRDTNTPGGKLNPTFVEFLMGFPENWTKIDPTE